MLEPGNLCSAFLLNATVGFPDRQASALRLGLHEQVQDILMRKQQPTSRQRNIGNGSPAAKRPLPERSPSCHFSSHLAGRSLPCLPFGFHVGCKVNSLTLHSPAESSSNCVSSPAGSTRARMGSITDKFDARSCCVQYPPQLVLCWRQKKKETRIL